jgi:hypothetical protein
MIHIYHDYSRHFDRVDAELTHEQDRWSFETLLLLRANLTNDPR